MDLNQFFPNGLNLETAVEVLRPLSIYVIGIAIYAVFVFKFYRFLAARDMFSIDIYKYEESSFQFIRKFFHLVAYVGKYLVLFPFFAFFWFAVLVIMLTFLSDGRGMDDTLLIALATVSAIRFAAYYDEDLSRDLAKILPFALLALFLINASFFDIEGSFENLQTVDEHLETAVYYLVFLIGLELVLRFGFGFSVWLFTKRPVKSSAQASSPQATEQADAVVEESSTDASDIEEDQVRGPETVPAN